MSNERVTQDGVRLRLESRLKNALLVGAREKLGLTLMEVAKSIGMSPTSLCGFENLKKYPSAQTQKKICNFYRESDVFLYEEDVFPESLRTFKTTGKFIREAVVPQERLLELSQVPANMLLTERTSADELLEREMMGERTERLYESISRLTERQQQVIKGLWGLEGREYSADELAVRFNVTPQAISASQKQALRKLREVMPAVEYKAISKYAKELPTIRPDSEHYANLVRNVGAERNSRK